MVSDKTHYQQDKPFLCAYAMKSCGCSVDEFWWVLVQRRHRLLISRSQITNHWRTRLNVSVRSRSTGNLEVLLFEERGKQDPGKNPSEQGREPTTNSTHIWQGDWAEWLFAKRSGTVAKDREKNWPIADRRVPSNDPINTCGTHFLSSSLLLSKVAKVASSPGCEPGPQ